MKMLNEKTMQFVAGGRMSVKEFDSKTKNLYSEICSGLEESRERLRSLEYPLTKGYACFKKIVSLQDEACLEDI